MSLTNAEARVSIPSHFGLWTLALLLFVAGDTLTTAYGLSVGLVESNPAPAHIIEAYGHWGMVAVKALFVSVVGVAYMRIRPRTAAVGIPLGLISVGGIVTAYNALLIAHAL